jgi:outer membrane protein TolC
MAGGDDSIGSRGFQDAVSVGLTARRGMDNLRFQVNARAAAVWAMTLGGLALAGGASAQEAAPVPVPAPEARKLSLAEAVALALRGNFGLLSAADGVASARLSESASKAQFYPKLTPRYQRGPDEARSFGLDAAQRLPWSGASLTASGSFFSNPSSDSAASRTTDLRLVLTQPLLRGFGPTATYFDLRNSRRGREAQERQFSLARQRLAVEVAGAFYQVVKQRQLLSVAQQSLERSESLEQASEARMQVGLASKLDVYRAQLRASQATGAMVSSDAGLETALEQFRVMLGVSPNDPAEPAEVTPSEQLDLEIEPMEVLLERATQNRLELAESRDQVRDAERAAAVARQNLLPQLDLNLGMSQTGAAPSFSESFKAEARWNVFLSTSYPLERTSDRTGKAQAELTLAARKRALRQREFDVEAEVRSAVRNLVRIEKSVELQKKAVELAEDEHRLATLRYQRGLASNLEVVDAEGSLVLARTALVGLVTDYQVARIQLLLTTGELDVESEFRP